MTQSLLPLLGAAAGAMVQVLIIATVGYICAKRPKDPAPLLTPDALKVISRVANDVFLPCLSAAVLGALELTEAARVTPMGTVLALAFDSAPPPPVSRGLLGSGE